MGKYSIKQLLKSKKGAALEMAVITMLFIFALCGTIMIISMRTHTMGKVWQQRFNQRAEVEQIAEGYYAQINGGQVLDVLAYPEYIIKENNVGGTVTTLEIYKKQGELFLFRASFVLPQGSTEYVVTQWNYIDTNPTPTPEPQATETTAPTESATAPAETESAAPSATAPAETESAAPSATAPAETESAAPSATAPAETESAAPSATAPAETESAAPSATVPAETETVAPSATAPAATESAAPSATPTPTPTAANTAD